MVFILNLLLLFYKLDMKVQGLFPELCLVSDNNKKVECKAKNLCNSTFLWHLCQQVKEGIQEEVF